MVRLWRKRAYLFVHMNFPAWFRCLTTVLGRSSDNEVVFITNDERKCGLEYSGSAQVRVRSERREISRREHDLHKILEVFTQGLRSIEDSHGFAQAGFVPDVFCDHSGLGRPCICATSFPNRALSASLNGFTIPRERTCVFPARLCLLTPGWKFKSKTFRTAPVREMAGSGRFALFTIMLSLAAIADAIVRALENSAFLGEVRQQTRRAILDRYDVRKHLPLQMRGVESVLRKSRFLFVHGDQGIIAVRLFGCPPGALFRNALGIHLCLSS